MEPSEDFSVVDFQRAVNAAFNEIAERSGRALLVAGTGLYLTAVVDRLEVPGTWPEIRERLEAQAVTDLATLFERLTRLDPVAASRIEPGNARRVVRALEVCEGSGRAFSSFGPGMEQYPEVAIAQFGLRWRRDLLALRIEARVHRMMSEGLLREVQQLVSSVPLSRTATQALGYKELIDHLEGRCSLDEAVETIITRTRQFAVRQDRWFRRDPRIRWIDIETDPLEALPLLQQAVGSA